jgi:hypothetical protein
MPDFQPTSEVIHLSFPLTRHAFLYWSWFLVTSCRTQYLPLEQGHSLTMLLAQSLLWDSNPQLWLS